MLLAYVLSAVIVLAAAGATPLVRRDLASTAPAARHFPGQPDASGKAPFRLRAWLLSLVAVALVVVVASVVSAWLGLAVAAVGGFALAAAAALAHRHARACRGVRAAIAAYAPTVAVPYAGKVGVHIGMWSPWIERSGEPWCIVARTPELFDELARMYDVPIVLRTIPDSVNAAFYPHGSKANAAFLADRSVTHVFLGHGDSDKPLSASSRVLDYDVVTVAGQAAVDRFAAAGLVVPPERIVRIGRPQTEGIERVDDPLPSSPTVLYAPTWRHADDAKNLSSLVVADRIVQALLDRGCTVIFRRHFAGRNHLEAEAMIERVYALLAADAEATGRAHVWGEEAQSDLPLIDAFNASDAMISDVSGIVVDYLATLKPYAMYAAQLSAGADLEPVFRASTPTAVGAYVLDRDLRVLDTVLDDLLGADPLRAVRRERATYYLGDADPAEPFIELVRSLAQRREGSTRP